MNFVSYSIRSMLKRSCWMLLTFAAVISGSISAQDTGPALPEGITVLGKDTIYTPEIQKGDTVEAVFYIANQGRQKFHIFQVYASCQCTAPQYSNDTFEPGRMDSVVLFFHSKNTSDIHFEKFALVLTPLGERAFVIKGVMHIPDEKQAAIRPARKIRITNQM